MKKGKRLLSLLCCFALTASMTLDVSAAEGVTSGAVREQDTDGGRRKQQDV